MLPHTSTPGEAAARSGRHTGHMVNRLFMGPGVAVDVVVPTGAIARRMNWTCDQTRRFTIFLKDNGREYSHLIRDRDSKFKGGFDEIIRDRDCKAVCHSRRSPNLSTYAERVIRSLKTKCLSQFFILGLGYPDHLTAEHAEFYNTCRPHSARGCLPPMRDGPIRASGEIHCDSRLGGLMKHYYREAAYFWAHDRCGCRNGRS
jgi:putative transposase